MGFAGNSEVLEGERAHPLDSAFHGEGHGWRVTAGLSEARGHGTDPRPLAMGFSRLRALIEAAPQYFSGSSLSAPP